MIAVFLTMSAVRYQKRFTLGMLRHKIVRRKNTWEMKGVLAQFRI
jgi:hypothetical protein